MKKRATFNQTNVELKLCLLRGSRSAIRTFNQTNVELKQSHWSLPFLHESLLIRPMWN